MTAFYGMQGHAKRGAAPGGSGQVGGGIGSIVYDRTAPDATYLPADGRSISAAAYPEYAAMLNQSPFPNVQLPNPATVPTGPNSSYPNSGPGSVSDDGSWFVLYKGESGQLSLMVYNIVNGVQVYAGTISTPYPPVSVAVTNNGDIAVQNSTSNYTMTTFRRTPGQYAWTSQNVTSLGSVVVGAPCWTRDGQMVVYPIGQAPWLHAYQWNGASYVSVSLAAIGLNSFTVNPTHINRSLNGERWVFTVSNTMYFYDFANNVFTPTPGAASLSAGVTPISPPCFTADLSYFLVANNLQMELWQINANGVGYTKLLAYTFETVNNSHCGFVGNDSYIVRFNNSPTDDIVYQILGRTVMKIFGPASLVAGESGHFGCAVSRDGTTAILSWQPGNPTTVLQSGPPSSLMTPPMAPIGYGPSKLFPFVKVRS